MKRLQSLSPYTSLCVLGVPLILVEACKVTAVLILGSGHWITGTIVMVSAYALSLFAVERLFKIVKPKLLMIPWFQSGWTWTTTKLSKAYGWLQKTSFVRI
jgi:hypothetical protein